MPSETDWAYAAGQLDADGTIAMYLRPNQIAITVAVYGQDMEMLNWLADTFGGYTYKAKQRRAHQWNVGSPMETFLEGILPYSKTKKGLVELVLEYRNQLRGRTQEDREDMVRRCKELIHRLSRQMDQERG